MANSQHSQPSNFQLRLCSHIISHSGVIAYPTESVYGLGCDPLNESATMRILELKNRPIEKGMILIAASLNQLEPFCQLENNEREKILQQTTPVTWLVRKSSLTPRWICGDHHKVAIRVTQHPVVRSICNYLKGPIVSTSANPAGAQPAKNILEARIYFMNEVDMYLAGKTGQIKSATPIFDIETHQQLR